MSRTTRRKFMRDVGSGMLVAGIGGQLAMELGVAAEDDLTSSSSRSYGALASWVSRMQEMQPDKLQRLIVTELAKNKIKLREQIIVDRQTFDCCFDSVVALGVESALPV